MSSQDLPINAIYTPSDEPYLGRETVFALDNMILAFLESDRAFSSYTHNNKLNELQVAACQIIPQGVSLALSIRELVRQGYLFGAAVLLRSLVERAAIISYLYKKPEAIRLWKSGWSHKGKDRRPSLEAMLKTLGSGFEQIDDAAKEITELLNHLTHGDPVGAEWNRINLGNGSFGYALSKVIDNPGLCDFVCLQTSSWLAVILSMRHACFPTISST